MNCCGESWTLHGWTTPTKEDFACAFMRYQEYVRKNGKRLFLAGTLAEC
jgi:hypothetical protein